MPQYYGFGKPRCLLNRLCEKTKDRRQLERYKFTTLVSPEALTIEDLECLVWNSFSEFSATVSSVTICTIMTISSIEQCGRLVSTNHISLLVLTCSCFCDETLYSQKDDSVVFDRMLFVVEVPDYAESSAIVQL